MKCKQFFRKLTILYVRPQGADTASLGVECDHESTMNWLIFGTYVVVAEVPPIGY